MRILTGTKMRTDMKKTFRFFAAALAIVVAASCAKEIENNRDNETEQPKVRMTFSASIDTEEETKTALNGKVVEWKESDNIKLFKNEYYPSVSGTCAVVAGSISEDKKFADFEGDLVPSTDYVAAYPADWYVDRYGTPYRIDFPGLAEQAAVENSFDSSKHLMIANSLSEDNHFQFKNVCALAKVTIGTNGVYSVKIEGKSQFSTYGDYGSIGGPLGYKTSDLSWYAINSNHVHSITLKNEDGSALRNGATYYIVLPACTIKNYSISICDQNGTAIGTRSKKSDFVVERNKIYDMGTFAQPTNYKIVNPNQPIVNASDIQSGKQYMIFFSKSSNHTQEDTYCWKVDSSNGKVIKQSFSDKSILVDKQYVFTIEHYGTLNTFQSYGSYLRCQIKSPGYYNYYLTEGLTFTGNYAAYGATFVLANHWTGEGNTRCDIDIWNANNTSATIYDNSGTLTWGTSGNSPRKFFFYEVQLSY